jgi:hypothetical protein
VGLPGLVRVSLRDKTRRLSGLVRPWRVPGLLAALDTDPETVPDLLLSAQRFFSGHPFACHSYEGLLGSLRRVRLDRRYSESPAGHGRVVFDLEARHVRHDVRGVGWRREGWIYYHDGEAFTRRRVAFRIPAWWRVDGAPEDLSPQPEWNESGPEPFGYLLGPDG